MSAGTPHSQDSHRCVVKARRGGDDELCCGGDSCDQVVWWRAYTNVVWWTRTIPVWFWGKGGGWLNCRRAHSQKKFRRCFADEERDAIWVATTSADVHAWSLASLGEAESFAPLTLSASPSVVKPPLPSAAHDRPIAEIEGKRHQRGGSAWSVCFCIFFSLSPSLCVSVLFAAREGEWG